MIHRALGRPVPVEFTDDPRVVAGERPTFDFRLTRLAALFHDVGKPRTRGYQPGKGTTFHLTLRRA